jgi:glycine/D-amino acid oxidase-like deaminating enzyme
VLWSEQVDPVAAGLRDTTLEVLPAHVDVVVVGGGYCGLEAATTLASLGRSVVVLDRHDLGWGASSRNGGMVIPELKAGPRTLEAKYGPLGLELHAEVEAAFDHVESLVGDGGIDCDYERSGQLYVTHGRRGAARLEALAQELTSVGGSARYVEGQDLVAEAGSRLFAAGVVIDRTGGLHPAKFHAGLGARARAAGAVLAPHTAVSSIQRASGAGHVVHTERGNLHADHVLLATNAYADGVDPSLRRRVLPMDSFIIATEPLLPDVAATVLPTRRMTFNDRNLLWYWRHGPDGRLLFGGRKRLGRVSLTEARDHLYESMLTAHPQLVGTRVDRVWGGRVALTLDRLPHCGRLDGLWYATGCNGSGVALNTWMGRRMAEAICGADLPPFAGVPHRSIPAHSMRDAWLPVVGEWFRVQDLVDR